MGVLEKHAAEIEALARYGRIAWQRCLVGAAGGNMSVRVGEYFLVTATDVALRALDEESVLVMDDDGEIIDGLEGLRPPEGIGCHLAVYRERPDVSAVLHLHPPHVAAFAVLGRTVPAVTLSARNKLRQGPVVPEASGGAAELAEAVSQAVAISPDDTSIIVLAGHGMIAFGPSLEKAYNDAELAEETALVAIRVAELERSAERRQGAR